MIASDKPYFLEVCVEKEDNVFPMIPTGALLRYKTTIMSEINRYTISVYSENNVGLLNRVSAIFLKRHINLLSFSTSI